MKEMKVSQWHPREGECQFTPPLELLGVYIASTTIAKMVHNDELHPAAALYLNSALGLNAFCVVHHASHESISQHNQEHVAFENTAYRLGLALLYILDDGFREAHRLHHLQCGTSRDPDHFAENSSLPTLGHAMFCLATTPTYASSGAGTLTATSGAVLRFLGTRFTRWALNSWIVKKYAVNWNNVLLKMTGYEARKMIESHKDYQKLHRTIQSSWTGAITLSTVVGFAMFARYVHRHAPDPDREHVGSYYDTTFRGQTEVDLWMMGEGAHHLHHAKSDVPYSLLPKICEDIENRRPDLMAKSRGTANLEGMENARGDKKTALEEAKHLDPLQDVPPMPFNWQRTESVLAGKDQMTSDLPSAVEQISGAVLDSAIHVCTTADLGFLKKMTHDMGFPKMQDEDPHHPIPASRWSTEVFTSENVKQIQDARVRIQHEVSEVARRVGGLVQAQKGLIGNDDDLKSRYLDFFFALTESLTSVEARSAFVEALVEHISPGSSHAIKQCELLQRLKVHLESEVPSNFKADRPVFGGSEEQARQHMRDMFLGPVVYRSRL